MTDVSFGRWLKQCRKNLDLTQEELAEQVGCSAVTIRKIESGARRPSRQIAERLARLLELEPDQHAAFVRAARAPIAAEADDADDVDDLAGEPTAEAARPAPNRMSYALPAQPTQFLGREAELAEIGRLLADPGCRLLTLIGPGGIGKTRLALQAAAEQKPAFPDGVVFVPLAPLAGPDGLAPAIAEAVNPALYSSSSPTAQLRAYLRDKRVLLVLDNLEHLLDGVDALAELLDEAPGVRLLVTSRERLNLRGEWVFELHGLPYPKADHEQRIDGYSAVSLFVQSARRVQTGLVFADHDWPQIARICQLVEGMPLGIELAASWVRVLSCQEIAQEIERNLDFLAAAQRNTPERHRSLRAVFEHSWNLLSNDEQRVLRRLAVFRGGFTREAAADVAAAGLGVLAALMDKSLLRWSAAGRYDMHEMVRQYAIENLQRDQREHAEAAGRHCSYYARMLRQREERLKSGDQKAVVAELSVESENIRMSWEWAVAHRQAAEIKQSAHALFWFYELRSLFRVAAAAFASAVAALGATPEAERSPEHAVALGAAQTYQGYFCFQQGQYAQARTLLRESVERLRNLDDPVALAHALAYCGVVSHLMGEYDEGRALLEESLAVSTANAYTWNVALCLTELASVATAVGEYQQAARLFDSALARWREVGDPRGTAFTLVLMSQVEVVLGSYAAAQRQLHESLRISGSIGDRWVLGMAMSHLGMVAHAQGEYAEAAYLLRESLALFRSMGERWSLARTLNLLGAALYAQGDEREAQQAFRDAFATATAAQVMPLALESLVGTAMLLANQQSVEEALELLTHVLRHPARTRDTSDRAERLQEELASALPPAQVVAVQERGMARSFDVAVRALISAA